MAKRLPGVGGSGFLIARVTATVVGTTEAKVRGDQMGLKGRNAAAVAAATAVLVLGATAAAAAPPAGRAATVDRIVVYKGDGMGDAGPAGPLSATKYTTSATPETIHTSVGEFIVDTALQYSGVTKGGYWWFKVNPNTVILHAFHWKKTNGDVVEATNLQNIQNNNNAWFSLGNGVISPRCLSYVPPGAIQPKFIQLTKKNGDWKSTTKPCTTAP